MNKLNHHLRQYRHNNSNGLIPAYEKKGTETLVACLEVEIADLNKQVSDLTLSKTFVSVSLTKLQILHNKRVDEVLSLKELIESKAARTLGRISRIERQEDEIAALKAQFESLQKLACSLNFEANGGNGDMFYSVRDEILKNETKTS